MDNKPPFTTSGGLTLSHDKLTVPPIHIPDAGNGTFKTELTLERNPLVGTEKILWWHADDPREQPHNHPWDFTSTILHGGYTEERFWMDEVTGNILSDEITYKEGDTNTLKMNVFHNVRHVLPETATHLMCGPAVEGNEWHYLDLDNGDLLSSKDPEFVEKLRILNPFL